MTKIFDLDLRKGSLIEKYSGTQGTATNVNFKKIEKGLALTQNDSAGSSSFGDLSSWDVGTGDFSMVTMFKYNKAIAASTHVFGKRGGEGTWIRQYINSGGVLLCEISGSTNVSTPSLVVGNTYLAITSRKAGVCTMYLNNVLTDTDTIAGTVDNTGSVTLFKWSSETPSETSIYRASLYDHELTQTERNELYKEFQNSYGTTEQKRGFVFPRPTDLSSEVDSVVGADAIVNGGFDTDTDWVKANADWTISGGKLNSDGASDATYQTYVYDASKKYRVTYTLSNYVSGQVKVRVGSGSIATYRSANGTYTEDMYPSGANQMRIGDGALTGSIDNITVTELTGLVAAFNFIPSAGGVLVDISGNGNNGTINGALSTKDGMKSSNATTSDVAFSTAIFTQQTVWSLACRFKDFFPTNPSFTFGGDFERNLMFNKNGCVAMRDSGSNYVLWDGSGNTESVLSASLAVGEHDLYFSSDGTDITLYWNGLSMGYITPATTQFNLDRIFNGYSPDTNGTIVGLNDLKVYNRTSTAQQAKDYHNSFVKPVLRETFSDAGVGDTTTREWTEVSGDGEVKEVVIEQGDLLAGWDFTSGWSSDAGLTINDADTFTTTGAGGIYLTTGILTVGKKYKVTITGTNTGSGISIRSSHASSGSHIIGTDFGTYEYVVLPGSDGKFKIRNDDAGITDATTLSIVEIPALPGQSTGDKYWEQGTAGIRAIQSKDAYGEWEFDVNKGADGNRWRLYFINSNNLVTSNNGYRFDVGTDEAFTFRPFANGVAGSTMFMTAASYIDNNTDYRLKVARLKSEGVFKDIPTLQTSACENAPALSYVSFTSNGRYGFDAVSDGTGSQIAGTSDEIPIVDTKKYLVEFDLKLNSGTAPNFELCGVLEGATLSVAATSINGRNSSILTATGTDTTGAIRFYNVSTSVDFKVSGLTIRRIYDADTFAVFIKGGDFGNDYTLVDVSGGSGTNPVADSTYTTSEYFVTDLDAADRISNIIVRNSVKQ